MSIFKPRVSSDYETRPLDMLLAFLLLLAAVAGFIFSLLAVQFVGRWLTRQGSGYVGLVVWVLVVALAVAAIWKAAQRDKGLPDALRVTT